RPPERQVFARKGKSPHNARLTASCSVSRRGFHAGAAASRAMGSNHTPSRCTVSKVCQVTGKRTISGNNVSHSNRKTRRRFMPNLHERRFWVASENRWVKLRISNAALRTIDKNGIDAVLADLRKQGEKV